MNRPFFLSELFFSEIIFLFRNYYNFVFLLFIIKCATIFFIFRYPKKNDLLIKIIQNEDNKISFVFLVNKHHCY